MLTQKEVEHVAKLSRLALSEEEKQKYARQLSEIIGHFQQLEELNTQNIEPMAHVLPLKNIMREDETIDSSIKDKILQNAPDEENGYFKVPKI